MCNIAVRYWCHSHREYFYEKFILENDLKQCWVTGSLLIFVFYIFNDFSVFTRTWVSVSIFFFLCISLLPATCQIAAVQRPINVSTPAWKKETQNSLIKLKGNVSRQKEVKLCAQRPIERRHIFVADEEKRWSVLVLLLQLSKNIIISVIIVFIILLFISNPFFIMVVFGRLFVFKFLAYSKCWLLKFLLINKYISNIRLKRMSSITTTNPFKN